MSAGHSSIAIIGAGVAGLTLASELLERGVAVDLFDQAEKIGTQSCSWYAGGMLAPWCERESAEEKVARLGAEAAHWWQHHAGGVVHHGSLVVAQPRDAAELDRFSRRTDHYQWLDAAGIAHLEPDLDGRFHRALYFPQEAHLNPRHALAALSQRIEEKGGKLHFQTDGLTEADTTSTIVDTRGFSSRDQLPALRGVKGEMLIIRTEEITLSRPVRMLHPRIPLYIVPRGDNLFMVGATMIESSERGRISARSMIELLSGAYALHPAFGEAEIIEIGTDVRPAFPDNLPRIIKKASRYYLNGLYRHGFLLSPTLARQTADFILNGTRPEFLFEEGKDHHATDRQRTAG